LRIDGAIGSWFKSFNGKDSIRGRQGRWEMGTILLIVVIILLLGGGGGYYGYRQYGGSGLGGALGLVLIILLALWFFGGLRFHGS
jgi:Protein of unknown function (DUF3309)